MYTLRYQGGLWIVLDHERRRVGVFDGPRAAKETVGCTNLVAELRQLFPGLSQRESAGQAMLEPAEDVNGGDLVELLSERLQALDKQLRALKR